MVGQLPKWCQTHSFKEFLELIEEDLTKGTIMNDMDKFQGVVDGQAPTAERQHPKDRPEQAGYRAGELQGDQRGTGEGRVTIFPGPSGEGDFNKDTQEWEVRPTEASQGKVEHRHAEEFSDQKDS